ncbi:hypothetical protein DSO57_1018688 [Entomophthora muscae]|uniref:Uncharacterized protein n=1 Tax=Entomophthora muscae TaxID=34485 RepID=A0ACC2TEW9_9FUNG|nr:hypothetical protein DSO57_1018688 [Entomophthora muscae]
MEPTGKEGKVGEIKKGGQSEPDKWDKLKIKGKFKSLANMGISSHTTKTSCSEEPIKLKRELIVPSNEQAA